MVYVGKASSLRSRVRSYFDAGRGDDRAFVALLDDLLGDVDVIVTRSEKEAVLLENELIKRHQPRFNIRLRDDKDFIVLRLDERHPYPRLEVRRAREPRRPGARYFGPYSSASSIRETLRIVNRHFQLRTCTDHVLAHRKRPCILHQIERCPAPCVYEVPARGVPRSRSRTRSSSSRGARRELVERLRARMDEAAGALRFEDAARLRDQLQAVERSLEKQRVLMADRADRDVVGLYREGPDLVVQVLAMRGGKLQDSRSLPVPRAGVPRRRDPRPRSSRSTTSRTPPPDEVLVPLEPAGRTRSRTCSPSGAAGGCGSSRRSAAPRRTCSRWPRGTRSRASGAGTRRTSGASRRSRRSRARSTSRGRRAGWSATTSRRSRARSRSARASRSGTASPTRRTTAGTR